MEPAARKNIRYKIVVAVGTVVGAVILVGVALVLLWMAGWWPEQLIPFVPFERV